MIKKFNEWYLKNNSRIQNDFMSYLRINTTTPNEERAYGFIKDYLSGVNLDVEKQYLHENLENHPVYIKNEQSVINPSRFNIKAYSKGNNRKKNKKVLFNVHIDVVPDTEDFPEAFNPYIKDGFMYGRGACDTKNNLIMLVEAIRFLNDNNIPMQKNVELDLVIEEEVSGNGTISSIMHGIDVDTVIVMEPTDLKVYRGHRGCITANFEIKGKSVHMGSNQTGINAIECGYHLIKRLKVYEAYLLKKASKNEDFSIWNRPLQVNIGKINGGEWPGSVAQYCNITSNIGFLSDYSIGDIKKEIEKVSRDTDNEWTNNNIRVEFNGLKNNAYIENHENDSLKTLLSSINKYGIKQDKSYGWRVSCDAHFYHWLAKKPTLIFGSGNLSNAHSAHERVEIEEMKIGILILADYLSSEE